MHPQVQSSRIASALTADEESAMSQLSAPDTDPQQQIITQTRHLTLLTSSPANSFSGTPPGPSPCLTPLTEGPSGTTPQHYPQQGEPASRMVPVLDAQPTVSPVTTNPVSMAVRETGEVFGEPRQATVYPSTDSLRPSSPRTSAALVMQSSYPHPLGDLPEQKPPGFRAEMSMMVSTTGRNSPLSSWDRDVSPLDCLPNEILMHILSFLDVSDLLATSRTNHHLRALSVHPLIHRYRLRRARAALPPLLTSPSRPTLPELISRRIFQTRTTQVSRRLARNLAAIRLSRRLPHRPSAESLAQRGVLPAECVFFCSSSGGAPESGSGKRGSGCDGGSSALKVTRMSPALVARKRAVERERLKDGLRRWVGAVWRGEVSLRAEGVRRSDESAGVGRVWRLRRFWEGVSQGTL